MSDELLSALEAAQASETPDERWMTTAEIAAACDWGMPKVLERLRMLAREGRLEVRKVLRRNLAGGMQRVPGYRLRAE